VATETPFEDGGAPHWFDFARHLVTPAGIVRRSDQALLAEDGEPASLALRAAEAHAAKAAEQAAAEAELAEKAARAAEKAAAKEAKTLKTEAGDGDQ
jgi:hypothetical protein